MLGGCSLRGGEGSILGIVLGTALLQVLQNLVNILGIPSSLNFAVMGTVILLGRIGRPTVCGTPQGRGQTCAGPGRNGETEPTRLAPVVRNLADDAKVGLARYVVARDLH